MNELNTKQLYVKLFNNKYKNNNNLFLIEIKNEKHIFWESCRDFSKEILLTNISWQWLSLRVDDYSKIIEKDMISKLDKWIKKGSLSQQINSLKNTICWLFDRHSNSLKIYLIIGTNFILADFLTFDKKEKRKIFKKLWNDNIYDLEFDILDMEDLCQKYAAPPPETFLKLNYIKEYELEQTENGHSQLVFIF